jgi:AcrR family transcriptional regulator
MIKMEGGGVMAERLTMRKKKAQETRARIQTTALDLFDRHGFENVSVEEIAQAAGCSVGNIYHYFKSKDELAIQVTTHVDAAYLDWEEAHRGDCRPARDRLLDFLVDALLISSQEEVLYTSFIHCLKYPQQGILKYNKDRAYFRILRTLIEGCKAEGAIAAGADVDDVLRDLVVFHRGMLFQWRVEEGGFDLALTGRTMAARLLTGLA